jgi:hypothetical protein
MPRIDSAVDVIAEELIDLEADFEPGDTVDVCWQCWKHHFRHPRFDEGNYLEHPSYHYWIGPDEPYTCAVCGNVLRSEYDD